MGDKLKEQKQERLGEDDADIWRKLLCENIPRIYKMYVSRWPNRSLAEELVQKTVFDAVRGRKSYDPEKGSPEKWLMAIARNNLAIEGRRRAKQQSFNEELSRWFEMLNTAAIPDEALEQKETAEIVREGLGRLEENQQKVLKAKYLDDLSMRQIGGQMGLSEKAVESLLYRARNSLRDKLKELAPYNKEGRKL